MFFMRKKGKPGVEEAIDLVDEVAEKDEAGGFPHQVLPDKSAAIDQEDDAEKNAATGPAVHFDRRTTMGKAKKTDNRQITATAFNDTFIIATVATPKKYIIATIRDKVEPKLGSDYYYGYVYQDGQLSFIATLSPSHLDGALSVFTPAFLEHGQFFYRHGKGYHLLETTENGTTEMRVYDRPENAVDLNQPIPLNKKEIPATLWMTWSLKKTRVSATILTSCAFLISAVVCLASTSRYDSLAQELERKPVQVRPKTLRLTTDYGKMMEKMAEAVSGKGTFSMVAKGDQMMFNLRFSNESDARNFMVSVGPAAIYENGTVSVAYAPIGAPPPQPEPPPAAAPPQQGQPAAAPNSQAAPGQQAPPQSGGVAPTATYGGPK